MNHFKFLTSNDASFFTISNHLMLRPNSPHVDNEYCFQFDDEEPFVFARGNDELRITINPTTDGNISFSHEGRRFKLFAREAQND